MAGHASTAGVNTIMKIIKPLTDITVEENTSVTIECQIANSNEVYWYKNGEVIRTNNNNSMMVDKPTYKLYIKSATEKDSGIYTIICNGFGKSIESNARISVIPKSERVFYLTYGDPTALGVIVPPKNVTGAKGDVTAIAVKFKTSFNNVKWYNNNKLIETNKRIQIINTDKVSKLVIKRAQNKDTGIYTAVVETDCGIDSSHCIVRIIDQLHFIRQLSGPTVFEHLPLVKTVNAGEEARLFCKVSVKKTSRIIWMKDQTILDFRDDNHKRLYYGSDYIGIKILNPTLNEATRYMLFINDIDGAAKSSCTLTVNAPPSVPTPVVHIVKHLEVVVSACGQQVIFDCKFLLDGQEYYYVEWQIGRHTVCRNNSKFNVLDDHGRYVLHVKNVEYGMEGEVSCALRLHVPHKKSILVSKSIGYLTIVPPSFIEYILDKPKAPEKFKLFKKFEDYVIKASGNGHPASPANANVQRAVESHKEMILNITYARLNVNTYYMDIFASQNFVNLEVVIKDITHVVGCGVVTEISWDNNVLKGLNIYFKIEMTYLKGFKLVGVTKHPKLVIANASMLELFNIYVSIVERNPKMQVSDIFIDMSKDQINLWNTLQRTPNKINVYENLTEFRFDVVEKNISSNEYSTIFAMKSNKTSMNIQKYYIGKLVKTEKPQGMKKAQCEHNILQNIEHKNIVQMFSVFKFEGSQVFVLEYLWGGDLLDAFVDEDHTDEQTLVNYINQICEALVYLHKQNLVHLDVKPENVMLERINSQKIKLIDFDVSKYYTGRYGWLCQHSVGTRGYIAPELLTSGLVSNAADMWSLGVLIYVLFARQFPFPNNEWINLLKKTPVINKPTHTLTISDDSNSTSQSTDSNYTNPLKTDNPDTCLIQTRQLLKYLDLDSLDDTSIPYACLSKSLPSTSKALTTITTLGSRSSSDSEPTLPASFYNYKKLGNVSLAAKDFLSRLFNINSVKRMNSEDALKHPWLKPGSSKIIQVELATYTDSQENTSKNESEAVYQEQNTMHQPTKKGKGIGKKTKAPEEAHCSKQNIEEPEETRL